MSATAKVGGNRTEPVSNSIVCQSVLSAPAPTAPTSIGGHSAAVCRAATTAGGGVTVAVGVAGMTGSDGVAVQAGGRVTRSGMAPAGVAPSGDVTAPTLQAAASAAKRDNPARVEREGFIRRRFTRARSFIVHAGEPLRGKAPKEEGSTIGRPWSGGFFQAL